MLVKYYLRDMVYGANDGIVTTFAVIAGVVGANLEPQIILIIGVASLVADGFSMAASSFLASKSHRQVVEQVDGVDETNEALCSNPLWSSVLTFIAFIAMGSVPLLPYIVSLPGETRFTVAAGVTACTLFVTGALRAAVTKRSVWLSGLEMTAVGGAAAMMAFYAGRFISSLSG
jgi:vacuolar iron transporter family protein